MGVHYIVGGGQGQRGEQGTQGPRGQQVICYHLFRFEIKRILKQGPPGENGIPGRSFSEDEVRDICFNVLRSQLEELTANLQGPPG